MGNNYLIPANTKKSILIFGIFTGFDLILFGIGLAVSGVLLITLPVSDVIMSIIAILPGLTTGFLIMPIPNYHNMMTVLKNCFEFFTNNQKYVWRGWCILDAQESKE